MGTADELIETIRGLARDGLQEMVFAVGAAAKWELAERFSREVMRLL